MNFRLSPFVSSILAAGTLALAAESAPPPVSLQRPQIFGVAHVALNVRDIAKSRAFYKEFLGYAEPYWDNNPDGSLRLTWIRINDLQQIELFPEKEAGSDRLNHVGLVTSDAEGMRQYIHSKGYKVRAELAKGVSGNHSFTLADPDGRRIEFVQYTPNSWATKIKGTQLPATRIAPRIRHAGFMVADLETSLKFYRDILGFEEIWRGSADGKTLSWVNMKVPEGDEYLELMLYDPANPPNAERRRTLNHICLQVHDVALAEHTLQGRPMPAECKAITPMKTGKNGKRQINCYDPDGTRIEIMDPKTFDGKPVPSSIATPPTSAK